MTTYVCDTCSAERPYKRGRPPVKCSCGGRLKRRMLEPDRASPS